MKRVFFKEEQSFLKGPRSRWRELKYAVGVVMQFIKGFRTFHFIGPGITIFGSARFKEDHPYYKLAREVAGSVSKLGFTIVTGGGSGIMEAANRGAKEAGGISVGCNIVLPHEQEANIYLDKRVDIEYFFVRKELLRKYSFAFIIMPGGFGTLDEFFETITLIQTQKTDPFPIIIMGIDYHKDLIEHIHHMARTETISPDDLKLILYTDSVEEAANHIKNYALTNPRLKISERYKPNRLLGEKTLK